ncbi:16S rRNA (guanine(527)-N(7))-methyltransferase RsmG [bacterium]|nr:16S rRNA (guanine(527)-N(7))-methyltransferase RsmG [bacterium]
MNNKESYNEYIKAFLEENSKVNLISKNDEKFLWEKHICDSLALKYFFEKYIIPEKLLDIGTGGGFPAVPIALEYKQIQVIALDSIAKKIRAIEAIKQKLDLQNLTTMCQRVENINEQFDVVTARAVASLDKISRYALPKVKNDGYFVAFKSRKVQEEIEAANPVLKKINAKIVDIIEYKLPLDEEVFRNLVVIKKVAF